MLCLPKTAAPALVPHAPLATSGGQSSSDPGVCFLPLDLGALDSQFYVPGSRDPHLEVHLPGGPYRASLEDPRSGLREGL